MVAYDTPDTVSSVWLIRGADGREYKPEDYLAALECRRLNGVRAVAQQLFQRPHPSL